ncbi:conjugal transfer nickase/helicase domain-containing protein [Legionella sp.]|uniref:conjugal transfer nickase/helicase domain-containing protein n=1 Tax=Legionella sp. TaxID=459 RepID=UPI003C84F4D8
MFHRELKHSLSKQRKSIKNLTRIVSASHFLAEDKRQALVKKMRDLSHLETSRYESLCHTLIENLILSCQNLPETANSYYSQPGGLVDHALNRTEAALSLFQEFMVQEQPDSFSEEQKLWQYALFSAAILQGIGKIFVDYRVNLFDVNGHFLKEWNPLLESMGNIGQYYFYEFQKEPEIEFRRRINLLLAKTLMPASGFAWIASHGEVLSVWLALLNEDERSAGTLGALLIRADALAIQRYFTEFLHRHTANYPGGRYGQIGTFNVGAETLLEKEQVVGLEFIQWMIKSLDEGRIMINKAPLFMVPNGMLMCQEMFQLFVREHSEYKNWQAVRNGFLALNLHGRGVENATSHFEHINNQQMQSGVVLSKYAIALPETVKVQHLSGKIESMSTIELINKAAYLTQFTAKNSVVMAPLQKLNAAGHWLTVEQDSKAPRPGTKNSV